MLVAQADTRPDEAIEVQVRRLVRQLDADELARRQAAETALVEMGPQVLNFLPRITSRTPPEVKQRLLRIQGVLQERAAEAATEASRVSIASQTIPLSRIVTLLKEQTGNQLIDFRGRWGQGAEDVEVEVDFDDIPFWDALDQILDRAGLTLYHYPGQPNTVAYVKRDADEVPRHGRAAYQGVFRIEPTTIMAMRNLRQPQTDALKLTLEVAWEPRLTPILVSQALADVRAVDEQGNAIAAAGEGSLESPVQNGVSAVNIEIPLSVPERNVQQIASLSGRLFALVPGRVEAFEFAELEDAEDEEIRKGAVTVVLQKVRKNAALYEVFMLVRFDEAANALESHRGWVFNNKAYLLDKDGKQWEPDGLETTRRTVNEMGLSFKFVLDNDLSEYRFVYETPAAIVQLPIEYELNKIPLP
jgi:hypothetical protein